MSLHLAHPALSTTGKRKGKVKFRNAEEAKRARELDKSWSDLKNRWNVEDTTSKKKAKTRQPLDYKLSTPEERSTSHIASRGAAGGIAVSRAHMVYTGSKIIGISTLHKSNAVPVFSREEAIDISKMRRG